MQPTKRLVRLAPGIAAAALLTVSAFAAGRAADADTNGTDGANGKAEASLALHMTPSRSADIVTREAAGTPLYIVGMHRGDWYIVQYGETDWGYCHAAFLSPVPFRVGVVSHCTAANVRREINGEAIDRLPVGERVLMLTGEEDGGWIRVIYDGCRTGYLHTSFLEPIVPVQESVPEPTTHKEPDTEEVRQPEQTESAQTAPTASPSTAAVSRRPAAQKPAETSAGPAQTAPAPAETKAPTADAEPPGYGAIRLSMPYYTQYDGRWADLSVGESGKTVRQIGCALTCLAMTESHRTGTAVTPDQILRRCEFTPSGSVYWPSEYSKYTGDNPYLAVYRKLSAGIPVIWHGQKADGSSHWVVIYGFTGGELTPSSFLIHDPGSGNRQTLAQYLALYPEFIKFVSR